MPGGEILSPDNLLSALRPEARDAPESGIVEIFNYGRTRKGLIPLWVGEGDQPTPDFIGAAAIEALRKGETFYTYQRGLPGVRAALAKYHERNFGKAFDPEWFYITTGGMHAIQLAVRIALGTGDEALLPGPEWPNIGAAIEISGAKARSVSMRFGNEGWKLDLDEFFAAANSRTKAIFINSPSNPTGWTATPAELKAILDFARKRGIWIICDEVYSRFYYNGPRAPSFYDFAEDEDRIIFVNTFSKNWAMTGWRIGWMGLSPRLGQVIENLVQYSTTGVPAFLQRGAIAALEHGDAFIAEQVERARAGRDILCKGLGATGKVRFAEPEGAFYLFAEVDGETDMRRLGFRLVDEANIGVAPGDAFGPAGRGFMRLCFLNSGDRLEEAVRRLSGWLAAR
jgi:aspartate/methionine/tyrosine aminotransferase